MNAIFVRRSWIALLAVLALAGTAAAQAKSSALLNSMEVRQLVERGEPADHERLVAHFTALADKYAAEARLHKGMAQTSIATTRRSTANSVSHHCERLAELNTQSATTTRELAEYHQKLAVGLSSTTPRGGERFEAGAGAPDPTNEELAALAAKASTPADHKALEEYFRTLAKRYTSDANDHVAMAQAYRGTKIAHAAAHCDRLVTLSRDSAKEANEAAEMHKQLAAIARE